MLTYNYIYLFWIGSHLSSSPFEKTNIFYSPHPHFVLFCHILHLHVYPLIISCSYSWLYNFCLLILVPQCLLYIGLTSRGFLFLLLLFSDKVMSKSFATPWAVAHLAALPMGFPSQEYWSGLPFPSSGDLPGDLLNPSWPKNWTCVSCIGRQILYHWATREAQRMSYWASN